MKSHRSSSADDEQAFRGSAGVVIASVGIGTDARMPVESETGGDDEALRVSAVDPPIAFRERNDWAALLARSPAASLCLRPEWLETWWNVFGGPATPPQVLLVHEQGQLIGAVPLLWQRETGPAGLEVRALRFLGTGEPEDEEVASEYLDLVALPGSKRKVARAVWGWVATESPPWDVLYLDDVLEDSVALTELIPIAESAGLVVRIRRAGTRYRIPLPASWEDYLGRLAPGSGKRMTYKRRKWSRSHDTTSFRAVPPEELERGFGELVRLHELRWKEKGRPGAFASARFRDFHLRLLRELLPLGQARLYLLERGDVAVAALYNLRHGGTEYFYQAGIDPDAGKYSPGVVIQGHAIEQAIRDGMTHYDFMKGEAGSYKADFGCTETPMYQIRIYSRRPRARLLALGGRLKDWFRDREQAKGEHPESGATKP